MNKSLKIATTALFVALAAPVSAADIDYVAAVSNYLAAQGYQVDNVRKTFWGRVKISASKGTAERELVLNPHTGEILRDFILRNHASQMGSSESSSGGTGSATQGGGSDDNDDDHEDDGDDDHEDDGEDDHEDDSVDEADDVDSSDSETGDEADEKDDPDETDD